MEGKDEIIDIVNDKKYSSDSAFFDIVNDNAKKANEEARVNDYFAAAERAIRSSIKNGDRGVSVSRAENHRYIKERAEILRKKTILKLTALVTATVVVVGGLVYSGIRMKEEFNKSIAISTVVEDAREDLTQLIIDKMLLNGSVTYYDHSTLLEEKSSFLEKEDFEKLNIDSSDISSIYAYVAALNGNKGAIDNFISSLGQDQYENFQDFCNDLGFRDINDLARAATEELYIENLEAAKEENQAGKKGKGGM